SHVPLSGGGWAKLPDSWLAKNAERLESMLQAIEATKTGKSGSSVPRWLVPEIVDFGEEIGANLPDSLRDLGNALTKHQGIPKSPLPSDLRADLREYQKKGVDWITFLRSQGLAAVLADDMGLGKTLQALCSIQGRTLVVCPTSVLQSWAEQ